MKVDTPHVQWGLLDNNERRTVLYLLSMQHIPNGQDLIRSSDTVEYHEWMSSFIVEESKLLKDVHDVGQDGVVDSTGFKVKKMGVKSIAKDDAGHYIVRATVPETKAAARRARLAKEGAGGSSQVPVQETTTTRPSVAGKRPVGPPGSVFGPPLKKKKNKKGVALVDGEEEVGGASTVPQGAEPIPIAAKPIREIRTIDVESASDEAGETTILEERVEVRSSPQRPAEQGGAEQGAGGGAQDQRSQASSVIGPLFSPTREMSWSSATDTLFTKDDMDTIRSHGSTHGADVAIGECLRTIARIKALSENNKSLSLGFRNAQKGKQLAEEQLKEALTTQETLQKQISEMEQAKVVAEKKHEEELSTERRSREGAEHKVVSLEEQLEAARKRESDLQLSLQKALDDAAKEKEEAVEAMRVTTKEFTWHNCLSQFRAVHGGFSVKHLRMDKVIKDGRLWPITPEMDASMFDQSYPTDPDEVEEGEDEQLVDYNFSDDAGDGEEEGADDE